MVALLSRFSSSRKTKLFQCGTTVLSLCAVVSAALPQSSHAAATFNFGKDQFFTLGVGVRGQYLSNDPNATPAHSGAASANDLRIYMGAQFHKYVKSTLNLERLRDGNWNVLDGILQIEPWKFFNVWMGRMLTPSDRSNLDGPYFLSTYAFPLSHNILGHGPDVMMVLQYGASW